MTESGSNSLADLKLPELKKMAAGMGIKGNIHLANSRKIERIIAVDRKSVV